MAPTGLEFEYLIVDVFTDRPLAGNPLCVVLDPVPEPVMPALAREVNLSETTFPVVTGDGEYEMRIFTPQAELPFAGHPSLGTAWALGKGRWTQRTAGATVTIEVDERGAVMSQPDPVFAETEKEPAMRALGLASADGAWLGTVAGKTDLYVLADQPIHRIAPNLDAVRTATDAVGASGLALAERRRDGDLHVRVFLPSAGIPEDPGTGSTAGPVGVLAHKLWGTNEDVTVYQGAEIGRPCVIEVHAELGNVRVGGGVVQCAKGHFSL